jgi:hypothetical protein
MLKIEHREASATMASRRRKLQIGEHGLPLALTALLAAVLSALLVRALPGVFEHRGRVLFVCLTTIVATEFLLRFGGAVLGIEASKRVAPAAWFGAVLICCHALGLLLWPQLYGTDETIVRHGSAWIMFAAVCPVLNARFWAERA